MQLLSDDPLSCASEAAFLSIDWSNGNGRYYPHSASEQYQCAIKLAQRSGELLQCVNRLPKMLEGRWPLMIGFYRGVIKAIGLSAFQHLYKMETHYDSVTIHFLGSGSTAPANLIIPASQVALIKDRVGDGIFANEVMESAFKWEIRNFDLNLNEDRFDYNPHFTEDYASKKFDNTDPIFIELSWPATGAVSFKYRPDTLLELVLFECLLESIEIPVRSEENLRQIANNVIEINKRVKRVGGVSFMPDDGICGCCSRDVTEHFLRLKTIDSITGCPHCGRTWCD